jgi:hypothetical protein
MPIQVLLQNSLSMSIPDILTLEELLKSKSVALD